MKAFVKRLLIKAGFDVRRVQVAAVSLDESPDITEYRSALDLVRKNTMVPDSGLESLYDQVRYCEEAEIDGALVECGVWKGGSVGMMALANLRWGKKRRQLHLFDSFKSICEPDARVDGERALREVRQFSPDGGTTGQLCPLDGFYDSMGGPGSVEEVSNLLEEKIGYPKLSTRIHIGWFQDTLPLVARDIGAIALLRLDGDWYASTKICLEHLAAKVVTGGIVVIDDYGTYDGCRKAVDEYLQSFSRKPYLHRVADDIRYWIVA